MILVLLQWNWIEFRLAVYTPAPTPPCESTNSACLSKQYQSCILRERLFFKDVSIYLPCIVLEFNLPRHIFKTNFYIQDLYILTSSCNIMWLAQRWIFICYGLYRFCTLIEVYVLKMIPFSEEFVIVCSKIQKQAKVLIWPKWKTSLDSIYLNQSHICYTNSSEYTSEFNTVCAFLHY